MSQTDVQMHKQIIIWNRQRFSHGVGSCEDRIIDSDEEGDVHAPGIPKHWSSVQDCVARDVTFSSNFTEEFVDWAIVVDSFVRI